MLVRGGFGGRDLPAAATSARLEQVIEVFSIFNTIFAAIGTTEQNVLQKNITPPKEKGIKCLQLGLHLLIETKNREAAFLCHIMPRLSPTGKFLFKNRKNEGKNEGKASAVQAEVRDFFWYAVGSIPNSSLKYLAKYFGLLKPTL